MLHRQEEVPLDAGKLSHKAATGSWMKSQMKNQQSKIFNTNRDWGERMREKKR